MEPSSTGGGDDTAVKIDVKVDKKAKSKAKTRKSRKSADMKTAQVSSSRPSRSRKPVDRLNIGTTKGSSYANVVRVT